ncbi:hypothetical protein HA402_003154 [Bradysia odoriphaga]|nr:hypothetical protein HA402_003154 [Bradysia odoriphaga]
MVQLISLNDDCFYHLFKWLPLDDLCRLSETCTKLNRLTGNYYQRKYPSKWVNVSNATNDGIVLSPNKNYVRCFSKFIQNLSIDFLRGDHDVLAAFLQKYCNSRPKIVQFKCTYLPESFGNKIKIILENAETIAFRNCLVDSGSIMDRCDNVKHLFIVENLLNDQHEQVEQVLRATYPKLEHLHCRYAGYLDMENLKLFFRNNKVRSITWYFFRKHWNIIHDCIETILTYAVDLEELFISIEGQNYNFTKICQRLSQLDECKKFKRLELQFVGEEVEGKIMSQGGAMASIKSLVGLHFCAFRNFQNIVPFIKQNPNLRTLQLKKDSEVDDVFFPLPNPSLYALPNLEQLHLIGLLKNFNYIHSYVLNSPKLKTVVTKDCAFTDFHLNELNSGRKATAVRLRHNHLH